MSWLNKSTKRNFSYFCKGFFLGFYHTCLYIESIKYLPFQISICTYFAKKILFAYTKIDIYINTYTENNIYVRSICNR